MKIFCIGRNYRDHAAELNNPVPKQPLVFMKPPTALLRENKPFYYPDFTKDLHYEVEVVLRIVRNGRHVEEQYAHKYYEAVGLGIDFTARDVQQRCKEKGHPWEIAKGFDRSAVLSEFVPLAELGKAPDDLRFSMTKNGETVQEGHTADLIFSFDYIVSYLSRYFTLNLGDYIYTGTPAGVGPVAIGDVLVGQLEGRDMFRCEVR